MLSQVLRARPQHGMSGFGCDITSAHGARGVTVQHSRYVSVPFPRATSAWERRMSTASHSNGVTALTGLNEGFFLCRHWVSVYTFHRCLPGIPPFSTKCCPLANEESLALGHRIIGTGTSWALSWKEMLETDFI